MSTIKQALVESYIDLIDRHVTRKNVDAVKIWEGARHGDNAALRKLSEEVSFGDLPSQIVPLIRRTMLTNYIDTKTVWDLFTSVVQVESIDRSEEFMKANFLNQSNIDSTNLGDTFVTGALPKVAPGTPYPTLIAQGTSKYIAATAFGEALAIDWQSIINTRGQGIDLVQTGLQAFAQHAAGQEDVAATKLLMVGGAVNANTFNGNTGYGGNHLSSDAPLVSILDLQAAVQQAQTFWIDYTNVYFDSFALVVPPQAAANARQVLSSKTFTSVGATSARAAKYEQVIDLGADITVVPNKWLTNPAIGGSAAATAWFLVPTGTQNPVLASARLKGFEVPSYFMKAPNAQSIGGGSGIAYLDGDFDSDSVQSKVRHVVGANSLWSQGIVYSAGTGTATSAVTPLSGTMPTSGTTAAGAGSAPTPFIGS